VILPETRAEGSVMAAHRLQHELLRCDPAPARMRAGLAELGPGIDRHELFRHAYCALLAAGRDARPDILAYRHELEPGHDQAGPERDQIQA
jgi:hypothetical protein